MLQEISSKPAVKPLSPRAPLSHVSSKKSLVSKHREGKIEQEEGSQPARVRTRTNLMLRSPLGREGSASTTRTSKARAEAARKDKKERGFSGTTSLTGARAAGTDHGDFLPDRFPDLDLTKDRKKGIAEMIARIETD